MKIAFTKFIIITSIFSQELSVSFRYIDLPNNDFVGVFVPGEMNNWGPNNNGLISPNAACKMTFNQDTDSYNKTYALNIGDEVLYKIHFHYNSSGTDYTWISDPLNPLTTTDIYNNSILTVTDPLFFQPVRHTDEQGMVDGLSVGIFTNGTVNTLQYAVGEDTSNGIGLYNMESGIFYTSFDPPRTLFESYWVQVEIDGETHIVYNQPQIEVQEGPLPEGVGQGPNWINNQMILVVFAPNQPVMQVIVTPPGVTGLISDALVMKKATDQEDTWWIDLELASGQYDYEYVLLNGSRIADPLSRRLVDGKTRIEIGSGGASTADDYIWQSDGFIRPSLDNLIIYELHVDDFSAQGNGEGTFQHIISKLDHLHEIGINAIELMPVTEFPGTHSWGYNPDLMSAVEGNYGTPEDLKQLVDQAHLRGIAIIGDMVWNHINSSSPVWQIQPDYNLNPYIKLHTDLNPNETEGTWGMLDYDHFNPYTVDYINEVNRIWIEEYRFDGFRYDATRYVGWDLNQAEYGLPAWTNFLHQLDPTIYQIAEHLPVDPWLIDNTYLTSSWHDSFHDRIKEDANGQFNTTLTYMNQVIGLHEYSNWGDSYSDRMQAMKYMVSHDEQSVIQEMVEFGNYSIESARERDKFYATLLFTSLGIPMLFQGQEFGFKSGWINENQKLDYRPIDWELLDSEIGQDHLLHYKKLISLRKSNPAFSKGTFYDLYRYSDQKVIVYGYKDESPEGNNDHVVVIANFSSSEQIITNVPFLSSGQWYDALIPNSEIYTADGNYGEFIIPAKNAVVYTNSDYELNSTTNPIVEDFQLIKVYPNPFNSNTRIDIDVSRSLKGKLDVYDISGRFIRSFEKMNIKNGKNSFDWNGTDKLGKIVPSGIYIITLTTEVGINSKKIIFVK